MLNVVVVAPASRFGLGLGAENMRKINAVSKEIKLRDASVLHTEEINGNTAHKSEFDAILAEAEVLIARQLPDAVLQRSPKLKWIQMTYTGLEGILQDKELVASPVKLTNASGIQAPAISEYVITMMLAFDKHIPTFARLKQEKKWQPITMVSLRGQTVGILGFGNIGKEIAKRAKALGMQVTAWDRPRKNMRALNVDKYLSGAAGLDAVFRSGDFIVSTLPATPQTAGMVGEKQLRLMKKSAYILNISRGAIIDESALIKALKEKWLAGAGLDVFVTEPLPSDNELWEMTNTIISPHCCGRLDDTDSLVVDLFCQNLTRYLSGRRLINLVNKKAGF